MIKTLLKTYLLYKYYSNLAYNRDKLSSAIAHEKYDAKTAKENFDLLIKQFEKKLTKAYIKEKDKKFDILKEKLDIIIRGRLREYSELEHQGEGISCETIIDYDNNEVKIDVEFKKSKLRKIYSSEELREMNVSLNYNPKKAKTDELAYKQGNENALNV